MAFFRLWFLIFISISSVMTTTLSTQLYRYLIQNYSKQIPPKPKGIQVHVYTYIYQLVEFNEVSGKFALSGFHVIRWNDERLRYDRKNFDGIDDITLPDSEIWTPQLTQIAMYDTSSSGNSRLPNRVRVNSSGNVTWHYADLFVTSCGVDLQLYPLDIQECSLVFVPWGYFSDEVDLFSDSSEVDFQFFVSSGVWSVTSGNANLFRKFEKRIQRNQTYYQLNFIIKRGSLYYVLFFDLPILLMEIVHLFVFVLPPESGERVGYSISVLLSVAVYLTIFTDNMPISTSSRLPLLAWKLFFDLVISCWIMIWIVVISRIYSYPNDCSIPKILQYFVKCSNKVTSRKVSVSWYGVGRAFDIIIGTITFTFIISSDINILVNYGKAR